MSNRACTLVLTALLAAGCDVERDLQNEEPPGAGVMPSAVRVRVASVTRTAIDATGDVTGEVSAFRKATVAAETGGRVTARRVEPGDRVTRDQVLVEIDRDRARLALQQARATADARRIDVRQGEHHVRRSESLVARKAISQEVLDDQRFVLARAQSELASALAALDVARRTLRDTSVLAPFNGTAEVVHVQEGDYLAPGTPVAVVADFSQARVVAGMTARESARVDAGQTARLGFDALGGETLVGTVRAVGRIADPASGTYPVEIWLAGTHVDQLREGMIASVNIELPDTGESPAVPRAALFRRNGATHVYKVEGSTVHMQTVRMGRSNGELTEILAGVDPGDTVVVDGMFALRDGARVDIVD